MTGPDWLLVQPKRDLGLTNDLSAYGQKLFASLSTHGQLDAVELYFLPKVYVHNTPRSTVSVQLRSKIH